MVGFSLKSSGSTSNLITPSTTFSGQEEKQDKREYVNRLKIFNTQASCFAGYEL